MPAGRIGGGAGRIGSGKDHALGFAMTGFDHQRRRSVKARRQIRDVDADFAVETVDAIDRERERLAAAGVECRAVAAERDAEIGLRLAHRQPIGIADRHLRRAASRTRTRYAAAAGAVNVNRESPPSARWPSSSFA